MSARAPAAVSEPIPIASRRVRRRPVHIEVAKAELVESFMDVTTLAGDAIVLNGAALDQVLRRLPTGPVKHELSKTLHELYAVLRRLKTEALMASNRYETADERPE